ncbi:MAG: hypothetical protein K6W08_13520 [Firmicutes bacterium]|nr:hypothetical protein [Bacillota bacterium]
MREIFPEAEAEIMGVAETGASRESARVWAFLRRVEAEYFPCYEVDEYEQVACGIPFVRNAWSYDRFHELDLRPGELLLFALCAQPYEPGYDTRIALLDAGVAHVPRELLAEIPVADLSGGSRAIFADDTPQGEAYRQLARRVIDRAGLTAAAASR